MEDLSHGSILPPKIKTNIKFDGGFEPWLISATKIKIKTNVKFDGYRFEPWLIPATKIETNIKHENMPNFGVFNFRIVLQVQDFSNMEQPHQQSLVACWGGYVSMQLFFSIVYICFFYEDSS